MRDRLWYAVFLCALAPFLYGTFLALTGGFGGEIAATVGREAASRALMQIHVDRGETAQAIKLFEALRDQICTAFEKLEDDAPAPLYPGEAGRFVRTPWERTDHSGAKGGGGHFRLTIVSRRFAGCRTMERHRLVYDALGPLMKREIHALSISAKTPDEH